MSSDRDQFHVSLEIFSSQHSPSELTELLSIQPDWAGEKGTRWRDKGPILKETAWQLQSGCDKFDPLFIHLEGLLSRISGCLSEFARISKVDGVSIQLECVVYRYGETFPEVRVLPEQIRIIADIGASLGFDIYSLRED